MTIDTLFRNIAVLLALPLMANAAPCGGGRMSEVVNPVIWADVPDPDVIRVDSDFYMVSTTMHLMPGCPVMKSRDLVNWKTVGYVFDRLEDTPRYDLIGGTVYGKGQWATSLRWRDGLFYVLFSPNDEPYRSYVYKTDDPSGQWELVSRMPHFHDASLLFDDDGRAYVFYSGGDIRLRELEPDLSGVKEGGIDCVVIHPDIEETGLHEGSRVIKHDGQYYAFVISWPAGKPRRQLCYRADSITGPYEKFVVLESEFGGFPYVGQGCLVDDMSGDWWGVIFQDRGGVGRVLTLNPCTWKDGVPYLGDKDGKVPASLVKETFQCGGSGIAESDEFSDGRKSELWQWNHNPLDSVWSLTERPGYLRLTTSRVVPDLFQAPNTISQRMYGPTGSASVSLDTEGMRRGDVAGFAAFNGDSGMLSVKKDDRGKWLVYETSSVSLDEGHSVSGVASKEYVRLPLESDMVFLRISTDFNPGKDLADFYYSYDGCDWIKINEEPFNMVFDYRRFFMGTRYAIYNYSTEEAGGYVDIDWFRLD